MTQCMLTTVDNPFDPFDNFEEWFKIDMQFGYNTCALVARLTPDPATSLPDEYNEAIKRQCLERYVKLFPLTYKLLVREVPDIDYDTMAAVDNLEREEISDSTI